jgi:hypothetical protein
MVHPIPDAVSFEDGAMMEPLSVGVHSVANLGEFKSDQVSEASAQPISTAMLIFRSVSYSVLDQSVYFVWQ